MIRDTFLTLDDQHIVKCDQYNYLGVLLDECLNLNSQYNNIFFKNSYKIFQFGKTKKYIEQNTRILIYKQPMLPLVEYVSFMLFLNRVCDVEKLQRLQNRCLLMSLNIYNPRDVSALRLHEICNLSYLSTRRHTQLAKLMFNLAQRKKFKKIAGRETRVNDSYNFATDIVHLGIYLNSPYYTGAKLWNDLPLEIKNTHDKSVFNSLIQRYLYETMNM